MRISVSWQLTEKVPCFAPSHWSCASSRCGEVPQVLGLSHTDVIFSAVWKRNHSQNPQLLGKKTIKSAKSKTRRQQRKECDQNPLQFGFTLQNGALEWKETVVQGEDFIPCPWRKVQDQWSFFNSYGQGNSLRLGCRHPRMKLDFSGSILSSGGYSPAFRGSPLGSESLHSAQTCWIRPWRGPYAPK